MNTQEILINTIIELITDQARLNPKTFASAIAKLTKRVLREITNSSLPLTSKEESLIIFERKMNECNKTMGNGHSLDESIVMINNELNKLLQQ